MKWIKRIFLLILSLGGILALYLGFVFWGQYQEYMARKKYAENIRPTASPEVMHWKDTVYIDYLDQKRSLFVYFPPDYEADTNKRYPVFYMLDGAAMFDDMAIEGPEWQVDEVLNEGMEKGGEGAIVIGIPSMKNRSVEYKPFPDLKNREQQEVEGDKFAEWLATDLKNWVDSSFRTREDPSTQVIGGASLGGLMAYYVLMTYPEKFGAALVMSPSFWVNKKVWSLHEQVSDLNQLRIYMNVGSKEGWEMSRNAKKMRKTLLRAGMDEENIRFEKIKGGMHWHLTWREGFRSAYPWIVEPGTSARKDE